VVLGDPSYKVTNWTYGVFFQDNWTVNPKLTLNLGLRYDLETGTTNKDEPNPLQPNGRSLDADNFSPRLGFAYDLRGDGRSVVRGGWGRYFDKVMLNITSNEQRVVRGQYLSAVVTNPSYRDPLGGLTFDDFKSRGIPASFIVLTEDFRTPVNDQTTIGFAQQLANGIAVQADYVHSDGKDEPLNYIMNFYEDPATGLPLRPATFGRPYPQYTNITWNTSLGKSRYDGLQLAVNRRGADFTVQASYTYSVTKDNHNGNRGGSTPTNPFDLDPEYTYAASDQRHRFAANALWTIPGNIQVAAIFFAGSSRTIDVNTTLDPFGLGYSSRWLNAAGEILPRNSARTDADYKTDLRVSKTFTVARIRLQGIAEVFNVFNRENHDRGTYGRNYFGTTYLKPGTSTDLFYQPRQIQLGFRVSY
jgi:outer membrane receptor protein involved in Fe transport